jgi:predicted cupin superfamily sugar epimerase
MDGLHRHSPKAAQVRSIALNPQELIAVLGMKPHPEGGWYVETWRDPAPQGERAACTAIYFLLEAGQHSHWHRVDATEIWLWHGGAPLRLETNLEGAAREITLGPDLAGEQRPQAVVPKNAWQAAESLGAWTLVSCVVAPGFEFTGFELAAPGWAPPDSLAG